MKSGLEDRNNTTKTVCCVDHDTVSMKSGLEDRNNIRKHGGESPELKSQ